MAPTTAARTEEGVIAFMNAAFGLRFAVDFFAAGFLAADFFAAGFFAALFLAADFFAAPFFAAGFFAAVFFAAFLAVAMFLFPVSCAGGLRCSVLPGAPSCPRHDAPSAATLHDLPSQGTGARGECSGDGQPAVQRPQRRAHACTSPRVSSSRPRTAD